MYSVPFIKNEAPGYCVLISCIQFIKALNMSWQEFVNKLPRANTAKLIEMLNQRRVKEFWDNVYHGKVKYEELQKIFFKEDESDGKSLYDYLDPFTEEMYKFQCGMDIKAVEEDTEFFEDDHHHWENEKIIDFYDTFHDGKKEIPFFIHFCNFIDRKFTFPDHIYTATMMRAGKNSGRDMFRIRAYNSDNQQGVVEQLMTDPVCPLVFGWAKDFPDYGELPEYHELKPGGIPKELAGKIEPRPQRTKPPERLPNPKLDKYEGMRGFYSKNKRKNRK